MRKSSHNLLVQINKDTWLLANPLSGQADMLTKAEADAFQRGTLDPSYLEERGYLVAPEKEADAYNEAYLKFLKARETDEIQIFYVPTYACNFACDYCYQNKYQNSHTDNGPVMDHFFSYVDKTFADRSKYLTLFGGEPLLPGRSHRAQIARFLKSAAERELETAVVTNGFYIREYLELLKEAPIREVQVTLDGMVEMHNRRRPQKGGGGTFDRIVCGVDALLEANIHVNLRMVLDKENVSELPLLSDFAVAKGWVDHPRFKTQLGRNYELHNCSRKANVLFDRLEMYRQVASQIALHPQILKFHKPAFHLAKLLAEKGQLPPPNFDACPGTKTEWAFDYTGRIYSCTATVGKQDEAIGTFYPETTLDEEAVFEWQDRDILAIDTCNKCNVRLVCGGGCGALAKNTNGSLNSTDCRPIEAVTAIGGALYFDPPNDSI